MPKRYLNSQFRSYTTKLKKRGLRAKIKHFDTRNHRKVYAFNNVSRNKKFKKIIKKRRSRRVMLGLSC
jgi:hypothetical protein